MGAMMQQGITNTEFKFTNWKKEKKNDYFSY